MNDCGKKDYKYLSYLMHDPTMHTNSFVVRTMVNTAVQHTAKGCKVLPWFLPGEPCSSMAFPCRNSQEVFTLFDMFP